MESRIARFIQPEEQFSMVRNTTSLNSLFDLNKELFVGDIFFRTQTKKAVGSPLLYNVSEDFFRLTGLLEVLFNQSGFPSSEGFIFRHRRKKWKISPFHPWHQLALACYAGKINTQGVVVREQWAHAMEEKGRPTLGQAVWGVLLSIHNGEVMSDPDLHPIRVEQLAEERMLVARAICLPTRELNAQLGELNFSGNDVESMSSSDFERKVLPQASEILKDYLDPNILRRNYREMKFPFKFFARNI